jgi:predicted oxidoreductase
LGTLFGPKTTPQKQRILDQLQSLTTTYNATTDQLLLAWILKHPSKIHPVIGSTNLERIAASIDAVSIVLTTEDWFRVLEASQGHEVP